MLISSFVVSVVQNTIAVFSPKAEGPFNQWSKKAYMQGFSWRNQSVSFLVFDDSDVSVEVHLERDILLLEDTVRAIAVPFHVANDGKVEVSGIFEKVDRLIQVPEGKYTLVFQHGYTDITNYNTDGDVDMKQMWCRLSFVPDELTKPQILRQDSELCPSDPLVMDGKPA